MDFSAVIPSLAVLPSVSDASMASGKMGAVCDWLTDRLGRVGLAAAGAPVEWQGDEGIRAPGRSSVVPVLKKYKNHKTLTLKGTPAKAAADEIRKALPGCNVTVSTS